MTPVKNQSSCGSCYAFGALGNIEAKVAIDTDTLYDFSENNIKECSWYAPGCGGGNYWVVANHLSTTGTVSEPCDPYVAQDVSCNTGCDYQKTLLGWSVISGPSVPSVDVLKNYLQTYGPLYTTIYGGNGDAWYAEFASYDGSYTLYHPGFEFPNHAVLIVGWDDNLEHAGGEGAWIVKNSWGTSWGGTCGYGSEGGYFTIAYGSANIGYYSSFIYELQDYDPNSMLLYHDEGGHCGSFGYMNRTGWALCKFTPPEDCAIERVELWTLDATTDLDIRIYDDFSGGTPSNLLTSELDTPFDNAGYHSVKLSSPLSVTEGDDIYVMVKITNASSAYPLSYDHSGPRDAGSSYTSYNGGNFTEFTSGDLGIRVRTTDRLIGGGPTEDPVIDSITDVPDDAGGFVNVNWQRSALDDSEAAVRVKHYRIWRKRKQVLPLLGSGMDDPEHRGPYEGDEVGPAWEIVGTVAATGECCYEFTAPTECDMSVADTCWIYFCVTAHTSPVGGDIYSAVAERGYSIDNGGMANPPQGDGEPGDPGTGEITPGRTTLNLPEPNPGNGDFALRFELSKPDRVSLTIYDVTGKQVAVLEDAFLDAGPHVARWDAGTDGTAKPSPGLYFVRLVTGPEVHTVKLMLVR